MQLHSCSNQAPATTCRPPRLPQRRHSTDHNCHDHQTTRTPFALKADPLTVESIRTINQSPSTPLGLSVAPATHDSRPHMERWDMIDYIRRQPDDMLLSPSMTRNASLVPLRASTSLPGWSMPSGSAFKPSPVGRVHEYNEPSVWVSPPTQPLQWCSSNTTMMTPGEILVGADLSRSVTRPMALGGSSQTGSPAKVEKSHMHKTDDACEAVPKKSIPVKSGNTSLGIRQHQEQCETRLPIPKYVRSSSQPLLPSWTRQPHTTGPREDKGFVRSLRWYKAKRSLRSIGSRLARGRNDSSISRGHHEDEALPPAVAGLVDVSETCSEPELLLGRRRLKIVQTATTKGKTNHVQGIQTPEPALSSAPVNDDALEIHSLSSLHDSTTDMPILPPSAGKNHCLIPSRTEKRHPRSECDDEAPQPPKLQRKESLLGRIFRNKRADDQSQFIDKTKASRDQHALSKPPSKSSQPPRTEANQRAATHAGNIDKGRRLARYKTPDYDTMDNVARSKPPRAPSSSSMQQLSASPSCQQPAYDRWSPIPSPQGSDDDNGVAVNPSTLLGSSTPNATPPKLPIRPSPNSLVSTPDHFIPILVDSLDEYQAESEYASNTCVDDHEYSESSASWEGALPAVISHYSASEQGPVDRSDQSPWLGKLRTDRLKVASDKRISADDDEVSEDDEINSDDEELNSFADEDSVASLLSELLGAWVAESHANMKSMRRQTDPTSDCTTGHLTLKSCLKSPSSRPELQHPEIKSGDQCVSVTNGMNSIKTRSIVTFDCVLVREYERTVGDNPSCRHGPPISIGWSYLPETIHHIDEYENFEAKVPASDDIPPHCLTGVSIVTASGDHPRRRFRTRREFHLPAETRHAMLIHDWDCTEDEIRRAREEAAYVQYLRESTLAEGFASSAAVIARSSSRSPSPTMMLGAGALSNKVPGNTIYRRDGSPVLRGVDQANVVKPTAIRQSPAPGQTLQNFAPRAISPTSRQPDFDDADQPGRLPPKMPLRPTALYPQERLPI
jgi:hypothetical protein